MKSVYPLLCICAATSISWAQTAPVDSNAAAKRTEEEALALSPFVVQAGETTGYQATSTLAGTRIKSSLKDLSTTITVVTSEFLEDTGAKNLEDLLVYTPATEVPGVGGNMAGPTTGAQQSSGDVTFKNPETNNRIRSLSSADITRDYFASAVGFDSYNTERVEINRGANSILFGLGSPAGVINYGLIKPVFKDRGRVSLLYDSFGSIRGTLDLEKVIIPRKLSLRIATVKEEKKFQQEPAFSNNDRVYGVFEYRPFRGTTIRVAAETGDIEANRPRQLPPRDQVSQWFWTSPLGGSKLLRNPTTVRGYSAPHPSGATMEYYHAWPNGTSYASPSITFVDANLTQVDLTRNAGNVAGHQQFVQPAILASAPAFGTMAPTSGIRLGYGGNPAEVGYYIADVIKDTSIFDFRNKLLDGPNKSEDKDFDQYDFSVDQLFFGGKAGLSYAYHREDYTQFDDSLLGTAGEDYSIGIDLNSHLTNGAPNPNVGRVFTVHAGGFKTNDMTEREAHRLTGFFQTDFRQRGLWGRMLGRQTVSGVAEENTRSRRWVRSASNVWDATVGTLQNNLAGTGQVRRERYVGTITYLGSSLMNATSAAGANLSGLEAQQYFAPEYLINMYNRGAGQFQNVRVGVMKDVPIGAGLERLKVKSQAVVLQNFFFDDLVVATAGWRWDQISSWANNNPPRSVLDNRVIPDPERFFLAENPNFSGRSSKFSLGWVAHLPRPLKERLPLGMDLSLHYGKSQNTQLGAGRSDFFGNPIDSPSGETTELGATVSVLDNRLSMRLNWYETSQLRQTVPEMAALMNAYIFREDQIMARREETIAANPFNQADIARLRNYPEFSADILRIWRITDVGGTQGRNIANPPGLAGVTDLESSGFEFELTANLTPNWTLVANATQSEAVRNNTAPDYLEYVASRAAALAQFGTLAANPEGNNTVQSLLTTTSIAPALRIISQDGRPLATEIREWRFNVVTNYRFAQNSRLKGWSLGGALRWEDDVAIGFPVYNDAKLGVVLDTMNPYYGPTEMNVDGWLGYERALGKKLRWKIQVNVRNLLDDDDLIPVIANPDGSIPVVRITNGRTWEARYTLMF